MTAQPLQQQPAPASPLDGLAGILAADMKAVNAAIMDRLRSDGVPLVDQVAAYLIAGGGKRIRPLLTLACTTLYGGSMSRAHGLAASVEFIHSATLLHDDVVDESTQRRGRDTANVAFGNQASVLVGDFLFSRAFQLMVEDGSLDVLRILSGASAIIAQGEVMQLQTANNIDTTMDEYYRVIGAKTAALFAAACEIGPVVAGADKATQEACRLYGHELGMAFQIADDVLDYAADSKTIGKTAGDDFREGKMTAPVLLALASATAEERAFWTRTMTDPGSQTPDDFKTALDILTRRDALDRGLALARAHAEKAAEALAAAPSGDIHNNLINLAFFAADRPA